MLTEPKVLYEFGPFRVDPEKQVLLREDHPVAISPKVFETLLILVRHSRQVVSKEDLMKALWPDAFVEEANLSQNIFMLRKALGDTPEDRRYIVTHPGRGYRFAEQVRTVTQDGEDVVIESRSRAQMVVEQAGSAPSETLHVLPTSLNRKRSWKYLLPIASVVALLVVLVLLVRGPAFFLHRRQAMVLGEKDSVLVADFTNTTGDPVFDGTLRQGLAVQLEQSPFLSLVSEDRIQQALRLMGQPSDARLTPEIARQICERTASAAVLEGSIANMGSQYVLGLRATHCRTGEVLAEEQAQAARKEDVLNGLSQIASKFRTRVGESLSTVEKHDTRLAEATTPSLEAPKHHATAGGSHKGLRYALVDPLVWKLGLAIFCMLISAYGYSFSAPAILQKVTVLSVTKVGFLVAFMSLLNALGLVLNAIHSDRVGERYWHIILPLLLMAGGYLVGGLSVNPLWVVPALTLSTVSFYSTQGIFFAIPSSFLKGKSAAAGIAAITTIGIVGGFTGPYWMGLMKDLTGNYQRGLITLAIPAVVAASIMLTVRAHNRGQTAP